MSDAGSDDLFKNETEERVQGADEGQAGVDVEQKGETGVKTNGHPDPDEEDGDDLFGDDDDEDDLERRRRHESDATPVSDDAERDEDREGRNPLEYDEEDEEVEMAETWANLPLPQWPKLQPTDGKVWHMKLPTYVNLESRPFEADHYRETQADELPEGSDLVAAKAKMIGVRNTIRWRWTTGPDGEPMRQSNARMLRWSDGSVSLQLGSDLFDVAPSHGATLARPSDPSPTAASQSQSQRDTAMSSTTFLCVTAPAEQVLVTETSIAGQLSLVPTSMDSKTHLELVKHVGQQHVKHSRMKILDDTLDKETVSQLLAKAGPQRPGAAVAKKGTPRKGRSGGGGGGGGGRGGGGGARRAVKRAGSDSGSEGFGYDSDSPRASRRAVAGERADPGEYDEDDGFVVADSDEDDYGRSRGKGKGKSKGKSSSKRKSRSKRRRYDSDDDDEEEEEEEEEETEEEDEGEDEMEAAERRIEEREKERKKAKKEKEKERKRKYATDDEDEDEDAGGGGGGGAGEEDAEGEPDEEMDMDMESEEE